MTQAIAQSPMVTPPAVVPFPPRLWVPMAESGICLPAGTHVARGQPLTSGENPPLAPADGIIASACQVTLCNARTCTAIQLDVDVQPEPSAEATLADVTTSQPDNLQTLIDRLRHGGIVAQRATSPDLLAQLQAAALRPADMLVCNLIDVDAGSTLCAHLVREHGPLIVSAVAAIARAAGTSRAWIAATARLAGRMSVHVRKAGPAAGKIKIAALSSDYPQSDPTLVLYALSGRRLQPGMLPPEVGAIVLDAAAAVSIGRCLLNNEPMLTVPIEVRDSRRGKSFIITAAVGTPLRDVLAALGLRGPFMLRGGAALRDLKLPPDAIVGGGELSIDAGPIAQPINPDACIRCGWCVENCPVRIHPAAILDAAQENDTALANRYGLAACIECGICSYVCPSRLPLLESIRGLRRDARSKL